ncbi:MAG: HEAT repeat domain-containing protein, partial [Theionarchaea archaeon]|nr:HEAT repeat domain-containing protein [Theionarchaea archaeon]
AEIGGKRAVDPLINSLQDTSEEVRKAAVKSLGRTGGERAIELLIRLLQDDDSRLREGAAAALGKVRDPRVVDPLIYALEDQEERVRRAAVKALGMLRDKKALEPLLRALKEEWIRCSIRMIGFETSNINLPALDDNWNHIEILKALHKIEGGKIIEPLIEILEETQHSIGKDLAQALRYFLERYGITFPEITHAQNKYRKTWRITREGLADLERESQH